MRYSSLRTHQRNFLRLFFDQTLLAVSSCSESVWGSWCAAGSWRSTYRNNSNSMRILIIRGSFSFSYAHGDITLITSQLQRAWDSLKWGEKINLVMGVTRAITSSSSISAAEIKVPFSFLDLAFLKMSTRLSCNKRLYMHCIATGTRDRWKQRKFAALWTAKFLIPISPTATNTRKRHCKFKHQKKQKGLNTKTEGTKFPSRTKLRNGMLMLSKYWDCLNVLHFLSVAVSCLVVEEE